MTDQPTPLRQRLRDATVEAMLASAEQIMAAKGYDKATMQEIAAAAGCATGTFYLYFKNKEVLFQEIVARHADVAFNTAYQAMESATDPLEKIRLGSMSMARYAAEHKPLFRLFFTALPVRYRALHQQLTGTTLEHHQQYDRLELEQIRLAQQAGQIRKDIPALAVQEFMSAVWMSTIEAYVFSEEDPPLEEQFSLLWGLTTNGITTGRRDR